MFLNEIFLGMLAFFGLTLFKHCLFLVHLEQRDWASHAVPLLSDGRDMGFQIIFSLKLKSSMTN